MEPNAAKANIKAPEAHVTSTIPIRERMARPASSTAGSGTSSIPMALANSPIERIPRIPIKGRTASRRRSQGNFARRLPPATEDAMSKEALTPTAEARKRTAVSP